MNQGLQEQPARSSFRYPRFFEHFVALEKFAIVKKPDSALQQLVHRPSTTIVKPVTSVEWRRSSRSF
jgi:hypothetical protein